MFLIGVSSENDLKIKGLNGTKIKGGLWFSDTSVKRLSSCLCCEKKKSQVKDVKLSHNFVGNLHSFFLHQSHIWFSLCSFWELVHDCSYNLRSVKSYKLAFTISSFIFQDEVSIKLFSLFTMALSSPFSEHLISSAFFSTDYLWMTAACCILWVHRISATSSLFSTTIAMVVLMPVNISIHGKDTVQCFQPHDFLYIWSGSFLVPCGWNFVTWSLPLILIPNESLLGVITLFQKEKIQNWKLTIRVLRDTGWLTTREAFKPFFFQCPYNFLLENN